MKKHLLAVLLVPSLCLVLAAGCAKEPEPTPADAGENAQTTEVTEPSADTQAAEEPAEEGQDATESVPWPSDIPSVVPPLEGVTYTYVSRSTQGLPTKSVHFEGGTADTIKAYIGKLEAAGFTESNRSENEFGLDYAAQKDKLQVVINFVTDGLSHVSVIDMP